LVRPNISEVHRGSGQRIGLRALAAIIRRIALRPVRGDADKTGEGGNIDEGFNPLHARQSASRLFVPGWLGRLLKEAPELIGGFLLPLQQPDQVRHAGRVLAFALRL